jgi:predicted GTPase
MSRWRIILVVSLLAAPILVLAGLGTVWLVEKHLGFWLWWPLTACFALAYFLGWYWQRRLRLIGRPDIEIPLHWTDRDQEAWKLVETRAKQAETLDPKKLTDFNFYVSTAQEMALELARSYHPRAADPVGGVTIPELLAVVELASHDLGEMVDKYLPGSHLLSIDEWRRTRQAADLYQKASNLSWLITSLFAPIETGVRYAASRFGVSKPWQKLQANLLAWFYTAYVNRVGAYLIELHSGRLRVGVKRYRELVRAETQKMEFSPEPVEVPPVDRVTITVMGQAKVGKSSFVNAVLGDQVARTDVIRATRQLTRYELAAAPSPYPLPHDGGEDRMRAPGPCLAFLDTVGYGHSGPKEDEVNATLEAAQQSDVLVLVLHARSPARAPDLALLGSVRSWFASRPDLKMPPVLAVLTHIDLLSPAMEWSPPYHWQEPAKPKEEQIQQAVQAVKDQLGEYVEGCVPLCTAPDKIYGIEEWFLPALTELLDEAHSVSLLRTLRREAQAEKFRRVFRQVTAAGLEAAKLIWRSSGK